MLLQEMVASHIHSKSSGISHGWQLTAFSLFSRIHPQTQTPVYAVILVVCSCLALLPVALGSTETIVAIFSVTAPALDLSYVAVIIARRVYERNIDFVPGPFTLGNWGRIVNNIAIVWVIGISIVLFCPPQFPITVVNMCDSHVYTFT